MAKAKKCNLWLGTKTGRFINWGNFPSISAAKRYVRECINCYHEIRPIAGKEVE